MSGFDETLLHGRGQYDGYTSRSILMKDGTEHVFQTLTPGGIKAEGQPLPVLSDTEDRAWWTFNASLGILLHTRGGDIHWRQKPELVAIEVAAERTTYYAVWSRLFIGNIDRSQIKEVTP